MIYVFIVLVVILFLTYVVWQIKDRKKYPEKWANIDAEMLREKKDKHAQEYDLATQRIPPSVWILMNKFEKADALRRRENAIKRGREL